MWQIVHRHVHDAVKASSNSSGMFWLVVLVGIPMWRIQILVSFWLVLAPLKGSIRIALAIVVAAIYWLKGARNEIHSVMLKLVGLLLLLQWQRPLLRLSSKR